MNTHRIVSLWFAQGLAIELPLSHVIHTRSMGCGSQPAVHPGLSEPTSLTSEKSILPSLPRGSLQQEPCKMNLDSSLEVEGSEKSRKCEWDCAAQWVQQQHLGLTQWLPAIADGQEHSQMLKGGRWRTWLCKAFLNSAFPNYTFITPFCIFNSYLQILYLIVVGF